MSQASPAANRTVIVIVSLVGTATGAALLLTALVPTVQSWWVNGRQAWMANAAAYVDAHNWVSVAVVALALLMLLFTGWWIARQRLHTHAAFRADPATPTAGENSNSPRGHVTIAPAAIADSMRRSFQPSDLVKTVKTRQVELPSQGTGTEGPLMYTELAVEPQARLNQLCGRTAQIVSETSQFYGVPLRIVPHLHPANRSHGNSHGVH